VSGYVEFTAFVSGSLLHVLELSKASLLDKRLTFAAKTVSIFE